MYKGIFGGNNAFEYFRDENFITHSLADMTYIYIYINSSNRKIIGYEVGTLVKRNFILSLIRCVLMPETPMVH